MTSSVVFVVSYALLWILVMAQFVVLIELLRQIGILRERVGVDKGALITLEGLERGSPAPQFSALDVVGGQTLTNAVFVGRTPNLLVFLSPRCEACRDLAAELPRFAKEYAGEARVFVALAASNAETRSFAREFRLSIPVLADRSQEIANLYRSARTPSSVLIDGNGVVRLQGVTNNSRHLDALLREEGTPDAGLPWRDVKVTEPVGAHEHQATTSMEVEA